MQDQQIFWAVLAALFLITELLTGSFVLLCFSLGAAVALGLSLLKIDLVFQMLSFSLSSVFGLTILKLLISKMQKQKAIAFGAERLIGLDGFVIETIDNKRNKGRILVNKEQWRATADQTEETIERDREIVVTGIEGTSLRVKPKS